MMIDHFRRLARYNSWANSRLYAATLALPDEACHRQVGVFFKSLHGVLNHLMVADRIWLKRLTGQGEHPSRLDAVLYEDRAELTRARIAEDARLIDVIDGYDEHALAGRLSYATTSGAPQEQVLSDILAHLFNHQTHHRGQAHACLSILTGAEPPSLDLLMMLRGVPASDLDSLIQSLAGGRA